MGRESETDSEAGRGCCKDNVIDTVRNGQKGDRERSRGMKLSCRCYQVKPHTTGCRHGDTMVTTRCSTRKERDLAYVKELPACVSSLFLSSSATFRVTLRYYST